MSSFGVKQSDINYIAGTFNPTVTMSEGTVPVYSTNSGRYTRVGNRVFVDVLLSGDGGAEGAGAGVINIAIPIVASSSNPDSYINVGWANNNSIVYELVGIVSSGATSVVLSSYLNSAFTPFTGAEQANTDRVIRLQFNYEV